MWAGCSERVSAAAFNRRPGNQPPVARVEAEAEAEAEKHAEDWLWLGLRARAETQARICSTFTRSRRRALGFGATGGACFVCAARAVPLAHRQRHSAQPEAARRPVRRRAGPAQLRALRRSQGHSARPPNAHSEQHSANCCAFLCAAFCALQLCVGTTLLRATVAPNLNRNQNKTRQNKAQ